MPLGREIRDDAWLAFQERRDSERADDCVSQLRRAIDRKGKSIVSPKVAACMKRAMMQAGRAHFQKPTQNLSTSCENDLRLIVPKGRLTEFMGQTSKVTELHYRKTTSQELASFTKVGRLAPEEAENSAENEPQILKRI